MLRLPKYVPRAATRGFAKKAASGPKQTTSPKTTIPIAELESKVRGLNIFKGGSDPSTQPDSEYPEWVFELHKPLPSLDDLMRKYERDGPGAMSDAEQRRLIKRWNKARIKENNAALAE